MPYNHWFVSRQKRQLTSILPALIAYSDICVGKKWAGNTTLQLEFEDELQRRSITEHGKLRARKAGNGGGGTRTLFKQMKDLGLVFTEDENGICRLTLIGEALVKGEITFVEAMRMQLKKYQYPSAACWAGSGSVEHYFRVHPFQFLLKLMRCKALDNYLTTDEIAYIVIHLARFDDEGCFAIVLGHILEYRKDRVLPESIADKINITPEMTDEEKEEATKKKQAYYDIANTFCNYLALTQYIERGYKTISIRTGKEDEVDAFIDDKPKFIPNPELTENYQRAYGRGYAAKDMRDFERVDVKSQKEINEARIQKEYVLLALRTPITGITEDIVMVISNNTGIDEKVVEKFLNQNYSHGNIDDFFLAYKELAHMGIAGAKDFELATCEMFRKIFNMRAEHIGPIGNTPDVFVESEEGYCGIIDNKAYKNSYSITGNHKRVMEDVYIPDIHKYVDAKYPIAFFAYVAESFGKNIDNQVREIGYHTGINGAAMPVDILINIAHDYAEKGYDHTFIKRVFSVNREVRLSDLGQNAHNIVAYESNETSTLAYVAENIVPYGDG